VFRNDRQIEMSLQLIGTVDIDLEVKLRERYCLVPGANPGVGYSETI
jgi:hypothetical protein